MIIRKLHDSTLLRFLAVGSGMAGLYSVSAALATTYLPLPRPVSSVGVWILCIPMGFWLQRRVTFADSTPHRHALLLYAAIQATGMSIAAASSHFLASGSFWPDLLVHLSAAVMAAIISFMVNRLVVFPKGPSG